MLHHLSFSVSGLSRAAAFYDATLGELGYMRVLTNPDAIGYGIGGGADLFAIKKKTQQVTVPSPGFHVAFTAKNREAVDASTSPQWRMVAKITGLLVSAPSMDPAIMQPSSMIPMATRSKLSS